MKRIFLLLAGLGLVLGLTAQPWTNNLPANKSKAELTFFDYQKAFNEYWEPFNVERGFYTDANGKKQKAHGWKQFKRWEYLWESQIDIETGKFPNVNPREIYLDWQSKQNVKSPKSADWQVIGPSSSGGGYAGIGRLTTVSFHPTDNNTYWAGAPAGGVWETTDNGNSWTNLTDTNPVLGVSDILVFDDFETTNTMYIATGDRDAWDNRSIGVLKSTDGGTTWNTTDISYTVGQNMMVSRLLGDPNDNQTIIAATSGGVYKTTDGGADWSTQLTNIDFKDMEFNPSSYDTLYGSTTYGSVYRSTDAGANWTEVLATGRSRVELAVTPANDSIVYAIVANNDNGLYGIYQSRNYGETFTQVWDGTLSNQNLLGWYSGDDSGGQGWYDLSIAASPVNEDVLLVGGVNSWQSADGGQSWDLVGHWYGGFGAQAVHADVHMLKYRKNGDLFQCNDGGLYLSDSDGDAGSWTDKTNGMIISQIYKLSVSQTNSDETIIGLQDNGTKLTWDGNWADVMGGDGMECLIDYSDENIQYGTVYYGSIDRTTNHWQSSTDVSAASNGAWVTPYVIDPNDPATLYAGYTDVYKTTNRGDNWTKISTINSSNRLRSIAVSQTDPGTVYTADSYNIYKTTNDGATWDNITSGLPSNSITYITIKNDDPNTVWVTLGGFDANAIYETTDGGATWTNISEGLPELPATSVVQNTLISNEVHLYISTRIGIYFKKGADNWVSYNTNLPNVRIGELEIYYDYQDVNNCKLRAATYGRGLWESPLFFDGNYPPAVASTMATYVSMGGALINGMISNDFGETITESGFLFGPTSDLTFGGTNVINHVTSPTVTSGEYSYAVTDLDHSTTYYYQAYAVNNNGTGYGAIRSFTTTSPETYDIKFVVTDGNGDGIYMAEINVDGETLSTSPAGVAYIQLPDGNYTFDVTANNYNDIIAEPFEVNGVADTINVTMSMVGLEVLNNDAFEIYPNPVKDYVNIHSEGKFSVELYSEDGKLIEKLYSNDNATLNVKDMISGIYFIKITNDNKVATQKLIIE
ncbi:MAG: hypothetical protein C0599_03665 [Salinivirgaceae bacterium]|nr:MAG: hypothetical protein C0599_03665 [Salinivirgaceae bacterium]